MIDTIINPYNLEEQYIDCLNKCFPDWGNAESYKWCFARRVGDLKPDVMILKNNGTTVAGSAVTYRKVLVRNSLVDAGIMTGSWTLPEGRRQGCFSKIIAESLSLACAKGAALLLAFVTGDNASCRRLSEAGSSLFPSHYLFSSKDTPAPESDFDVRPVSDIENGLGTIFENLRRSQAGFSHFVYSVDEWRSQFLGRPGEIEFLRVENIGLAIIEKKGNFDRVLMLALEDGGSFGLSIMALLKRALSMDRRLFLFTVSDLWALECIKLGFSHSSGYLTALAANKGALTQVYAEGSRLPEGINKAIHIPDSDWYIGPWDIHSGDRM
jgi:hypothetical protein